MKRLALITTSLLAAAAVCGGISVNAEGTGTVYPSYEEFTKPLVFSSLTDYAVNGDTYAFAEHGKETDVIKVYGGDTLDEYEFTENVASLDTDGGKFYYSIGESVYSLPDKQQSEYVIPEANATLNVGGYTYSLTENTLKVADFNNDVVTAFEGEYRNLKKYGDTVYAVKDNALYKFDGATEQLLEFRYTSYSATNTIEVGQALSDLTQNYTLKFVTVAAGAYMTEVDLTYLGGQYFNAKQTARVENDTLALLLCYTGNAAVVAIGEKSYITLKTSVAETEQRYSSEPEFGHATVTGNRIYASPFVIVGTSVLFPATGTIVTVKNKIEHETLGSAFYEVEYTEEGETKTGYVTEGFLTEYIIEDNKDPNEVPDPEYSEKNDVRTVILIFMVVVLVLAAAGYLTYVGTSGRRKKKNQLPSDDESASAN